MRLTPPSSPSCNLQCCGDWCKIEDENCCSLLSDIQREYNKLHKRHKCSVTKRKRIRELALPKRRNEKFHTKSSSNESIARKVQIIYLEKGHLESTRTEQLAFPPVNRLLELKKCSPSYEWFSHNRKVSINRMIRNSLLSFYSRLSNKQPPEKPKPKEKWTTSEWENHTKRIKVLAKPKKDLEQKRPPRESKSATKLRRFKKLAKPKVYESTVAKEWQLTNYLKTYMPTKRIIQISKPKFDMGLNSKDPYQVKKEALQYRATARVKELAQPSQRNSKRPDTRENPFQTPPRALKAKASKRVQELAEPKESYDNHIRSDPFKVSPNALKAKITPRLLELSKPKVYAN